MGVCYIFAAAKGVPEKFKTCNSDLVIAADAGYKNLEKFGASPDILIGDFDSLEALPEKVKCLRYPVKKDDTDTMLAVKYGLKKGYETFVIYGGAGGRADHFLANLQTLNFIAANGGIGFLKGEDFSFITFASKKVTFDEHLCGDISVFATSKKCENVSIKGLLYEAEKITLTPNFPLGVSNKFIGKKAEISAQTGIVTVLFRGDISDVSVTL